MIIELAAKGKRRIAFFMLALLYFEMVIPANVLGARSQRMQRLSMIILAVMMW